MTPQEIYYDEYAPAAVTERLQPEVEAIGLADQLLPARPGLMIVALVLIVAGAFRFGMLMAPLYDNRGWAALVVFSIVGSVAMVNYSNRRG